MASLARRMCASACWSADEASTSAGTARRKCVTSSGRSSMSSRMRWTSGWCLAIATPEVLEQRRLARLGRRDDEAALAAPDGRDQVDHAQARLGAGRVARQTERLVRVDRDQVLEVRQRAILFGRETARLLNLYQDAASATTVTGQADDLRSVAQAEVPRDLRRNHDVVARPEGSFGLPASRTRRRPRSDPRRPRPLWSGLSSGSEPVAGPSVVLAPADAAVGARPAGRYDGVDGAAGAAGRASRAARPPRIVHQLLQLRTIAFRRAAQARLRVFRRERAAGR